MHVSKDPRSNYSVQEDKSLADFVEIMTQFISVFQKFIQQETGIAYLFPSCNMGHTLQDDMILWTGLPLQNQHAEWLVTHISIMRDIARNQINPRAPPFSQEGMDEKFHHHHNVIYLVYHSREHQLRTVYAAYIRWEIHCARVKGNCSFDPFKAFVYIDSSLKVFRQDLFHFTYYHSRSLI